MRRLAILAPLAAVMAVATASQAEPTSQSLIVGQAPNVTVTIGGRLIDEVEDLGRRDVQLQAQELASTVSRELQRENSFPGATVSLVLLDLKPNRPTIQQASDKPGLSIIDSISIGGADIEGQIVTASGETLPVRYARYSDSIRDVYGYNTWQDANRAYDRLANNLTSGRLVTGRPSRFR